MLGKLLNNKKGQILLDFLISFLIVLFIFGILISGFHYEKVISKIKIMNEKINTKYCQLENSLNYNYYKLNSSCGLFFKEDIYVEKKYG